MEKIAFIDLKFHKKTWSSVFYQTILSKYFDVDVFYEDEKEKYMNGNYNTLMFVQVIPDFLDLIKIRNKNIILVPVYDAMPLNRIAWERYRKIGVKIICFCRKEYDFFKTNWFDCIYLQYYLPTLNFNVDYSRKKIFFRYRWNIKRDDVKRIIWNQKVSVTIKNHPDPGYKLLDLSEDEIKRYDITFENQFFEKKEDYFKILWKHSIFIAPRKQEGIWMSFLESMSMWQCVIAYNDATMNEYIVNNRNGILTKFDKEVNLCDYKSLWEQAKDDYAVWLDKRNTKYSKLFVDYVMRDKNIWEERISIYDYLIDFLIKVRRKVLKVLKFFNL